MRTPLLRREAALTTAKMGCDLVEAFGGFAAALGNHNFKSLLLQFWCKRRDFCVATFDQEDFGVFHIKMDNITGIGESTG